MKDRKYTSAADAIKAAQQGLACENEALRQGDQGLATGWSIVEQTAWQDFLDITKENHDRSKGKG